MTDLMTAPQHGNGTVQLSIVIPAYHEERGIADILERILAQLPSLAAVGATNVEVIVVDDGSRDGTSLEVAKFPTVRLLRHPTNYGYGAALKTGFGAAQGEWLAFLDADGTYPPRRLRSSTPGRTGMTPIS